MLSDCKHSMSCWILLIALSTTNKWCWNGAIAVVKQSNVDRAYWTVCMTWSSTKYFCYRPTYQWNLHIFSCDFRTNFSQFMLTFAIFDWYRNFCTVNLNCGWRISRTWWINEFNTRRVNVPVVEEFFFVFLYDDWWFVTIC